MPTIDILQLIVIVNQRQRKWEITATLVCLYKSLKLSTDHQVTSQRFNSKQITLSCVI